MCTNAPTYNIKDYATRRLPRLLNMSNPKNMSILFMYVNCMLLLIFSSTPFTIFHFRYNVAIIVQ